MNSDHALIVHLHGSIVAGMKIWIDSDACPVAVREIVTRSAVRLSIPAIFVANKRVPLAESPLIQFVLVSEGPDVADAHIADNADASDLVITSDIPLAAKLIPKNVSVITPHGTKFTSENITEALAQRNFLSEFRDAGIITQGPAPFDDTKKRKFANHLDAELHRLLKKTKP